MKSRLFSLMTVFVMLVVCLSANPFVTFAEGDANLNVSSSCYKVTYSDSEYDGKNTISNIPVNTKANVFLYNMSKDNPDYIIDFKSTVDSGANLTFYQDKRMTLTAKKDNKDTAEEFILIPETYQEIIEDFEKYPTGSFESNSIWDEQRTTQNYGSAVIYEESDGNRLHRYTAPAEGDDDYKATSATDAMTLSSAHFAIQQGEKTELKFRIRKTNGSMYVLFRDAYSNADGHSFRPIYSLKADGTITCFSSGNYAKDSSGNSIQTTDGEWVDFRIVIDRTHTDDSENKITVYINGSDASAASARLSTYSNFCWEDFRILFAPNTTSSTLRAEFDIDDFSFSAAQDERSGIFVDEINVYSRDAEGQNEHSGSVFGGTNKFKVTLTNTTQSVEPVYVFAAEKNDGELIGVKVGEAVAENNEKSHLSVEFDIKSAAANDIELFVWHKDKLSPLKEIYTPKVSDISKAILKGHPKIAANSEVFGKIKNYSGAKQIELRNAATEYANRICESFTADDSASSFYIGDEIGFSTAANRVKSFSTVLGMAYQIENDSKYAQKLYDVLMQAASHKGWTDGSLSNLTAGYMTEGYSVGFDWCYNGLTDAQKEDIANVVIQNCFSFAMDEYTNVKRGSHTWSVTYTNWNAIANSSFITGALAFGEYSPQLCQKILDYASERVKIFLSGLAPDGGWWEGMMYSNILYPHLIKASESLRLSLGEDNVIANTEFFKQSADFLTGIMGPCGVYNFAEQRNPDTDCMPETLWFAKRYDRKDIRCWALERIDFTSGKNCALALLWLDDTDVYEYSFKNYYARGVEHITLGNGSSGDASWLSALGGENMGQHKHLDLGSFIYDYNGVRWAMELGLDEYYKGYQNSTSEEKIFYRARSEGHNTLEINPSSTSGGQRMNDSDGISKGEVIEYNLREDKPYAIYDLSTAYSDKATSVKRGFKLLDDNIGFIVRDEFTTISEGDEEPDEVYWYMHTEADIEVSSDGKSAILTKDGKTMKVTVLEEGLTITEADAITPEPIRSELLAISEEKGWELSKQNWNGYKTGDTDTSDDLKKLQIKHTGSGNGTITVMVAPLDKSVPQDAALSVNEWN